MLLRLAILALLPVFAAIAFAVVYFSFYRGGYSPPPQVRVPVEQILPPPTASSIAADSPVAQVREGLLVVDAQHANGYAEIELISLTSKIAGRGFDVEVLGDFTPLVDPSQAEGRRLQLASKLRRADSYVVILPQIPFSRQEALLVENFVNKGGRLLLVGDPGRPHVIDSLAESFGVDFQPDYLYNTLENKANFRNILVSDFQPDELTSGLETVALYMAGSLRSAGPALAYTGDNTKSSLQEGAVGLSPITWGDSRSVLAIADFTFLVPPHDTVLNNDRLLSNIADYVTGGERLFHLSDFPHFYEVGLDNSLDILVGQSSLLGAGLQMKSELSAYRLTSEISSVEDLGRDVVFLGLYEDAPQVASYLQAAGVRVDDTLGTPFTQDLELDENGIIVLDRGQDGRYVLIVLADTPDKLFAAVTGLISGNYRGALLSDFVGIQKFASVGE